MTCIKIIIKLKIIIKKMTNNIVMKKKDSFKKFKVKNKK